jgi:hypothetical protein
VLIQLASPFTAACGTTNNLTYKQVQGRQTAQPRPSSTAKNPTKAFLKALAKWAKATKDWKTSACAGKAAGWRARAKLCTRKNCLQQTITLTDYQFFLAVNFNRETLGLPALSDAPSDCSIPTLDTLAATAIASPFSLTIQLTAAGLTPDDVPTLYASPPEPIGRTQPAKSIPLLTTESPATTGPFDVTAAYLAKHTPPLAGQKISIAAKFIRSTNGAASNRIAIIATAA